MKSLFYTFIFPAIICLFIPLSTNAQTAYITNYASNTVSIIDVATNTVTSVCPVGSNPYGVCVSPNGKKVYISNWGNNTVNIINASTNTVSATVPVGINPSGIVVTPDNSKIYVTNYNSNSVKVIDTLTNSVTQTINVGIEPYGICVTPDGNYIYVANYGSNTVGVISTATNTVIATIPVGGWPYGITIAPDGSKVYVGNITDNNVSVISTATNSVSATINVGIKPYGLSASPDGNNVYVANWGDNTVSVISTASNSVSATINGFSTPWGLCVTPDGNKVYVANYVGSKVSVINTASNSISATITVGNQPYAIGNFIFGLTSLSSFATINNLTCHNQCNGSATVYAQGGSSPYTYQWSTVPVQTTQTVNNLCAGTYSVTVTDANGDSIVKIVTIGEYPSYSVINPQSICTGGSYIINGHTYTTAGNYCDTLSSVYGCDSIVTTNLTVNPQPVTSAGDDTTVYAGTPVVLYASGGVSYQWTPPDYLDNPNSSNPVSSPQNDITYVVIITDSNGCSGTDTVHITIAESNLWAPNVFNPNDPDPWNQKFYVRGSGVKEIKIAVYDRWGEKVFETNDINQGWDGTYKESDFNTGIFVYCIEATYYSGEKVLKKGDVILFR